MWHLHFRVKTGCCIKVLGVTFPHSCHKEIQVFPQLDPLSVGWIEERIWRMFFFAYSDIMGQQASHPMTGSERTSQTINVACLKVMAGPGLHTLAEKVQDLRSDFGGE